MKSLRAGLLATIAIFALPSAAMAEELIPPDNSAVNQYTETFPTPGGDKEAKHGNKKPRSPAKVLGDRNAQKLEKHGPEGRKVATVAAATAPSPVVTTEPESVDSDNRGGAAGNAGNGSNNNGSNGGHVGVAPAREVGQVASNSDNSRSAAGEPSSSSGSSGFGEVLAQATGTSSSGGLGLLLPLAIVATVVWAIASSRRRTRKTAQ